MDKKRAAPSGCATARSTRSTVEVVANIGNGNTNLSLQLCIGATVHPVVFQAHGLREATAIERVRRQAFDHEKADVKMAVEQAARCALTERRAIEPKVLLKNAIEVVLRARAAPPAVAPASPTRRVRAVETSWQLACGTLHCHRNEWRLANDAWPTKTVSIAHARAGAHVYTTPEQPMRAVVAALMSANVREDMLCEPAKAVLRAVLLCVGLLEPKYTSLAALRVELDLCAHSVWTLDIFGLCAEPSGGVWDHTSIQRTIHLRSYHRAQSWAA